MEKYDGGSLSTRSESTQWVNGEPVEILYFLGLRFVECNKFTYETQPEMKLLFFLMFGNCFNIEKSE